MVVQVVELKTSVMPVEKASAGPGEKLIDAVEFEATGMQSCILPAAVPAVVLPSAGALVALKIISQPAVLPVVTYAL